MATRCILVLMTCEADRLAWDRHALNFYCLPQRAGGQLCAGYDLTLFPAITPITITQMFLSNNKLTHTATHCHRP